MIKKLLLIYLALGLSSGFAWSNNNAVPFLSLEEGAEQEISGTVLDEEALPLPGVSVFVAGTTVGTTTDVDGKYSLKVPEEATSLTFSFLGYKTVSLPINSQSVLNLKMELDVDELDEVVIMGYGQTQNERLVSSAISKIEPQKMIEDRPIARLEQAIQGATPAVVVMQQSGSPGSTPTIRMRGVGTAGNATPLILLDNFQLPDMSFINPNDIGGIDIYKDGAASAIYGARGGNGVINIHSKSGKKEDGLGIRFTSYYGVQSLAHEGDYLNAREYAEYYNNSINYLIRQGESVEGRGRGPFSAEEMNKLPTTTWIREVSDEAPIQDYHLSYSGKIGETDYYLGGGIFNQGGIIGPTDFGRKTLQLKVNSKILDRFTISVLGSYSNRKRRFIPENSENSFLLSSVASLPAIYPVYAENGSPFNNGLRTGAITYNGVLLNPIAEFGNPVLGLTHGDNRSNTNVYFGNVLVSGEIMKGLKANSSFGYFSTETDIKQFGQKFDYPDQSINNPINTLTEQFFSTYYWQWEAYLNYNKTFGAHSLSAVLGTSLLKNGTSGDGRTGINFSENEFGKVSFDHIINAAEDLTPLPELGEVNTTASYYGRLFYNFKKKYMFGMTLRRDGSSKFGPENKWGFFPSVDVGWMLSDEEFMNSLTFLEQLKLRASWGINGNDRIPAYQYFDRYSYDAGGNLVKQDFNRDIKWEEITQTNVGLDIDLFANRIGLQLDYYIKETKDMLLAFPNPSYAGVPAPYRNAASVRNEGLEVFLMYRDKIGPDFKFDISANLGFNKNRVTDLGGGLPIPGANTRVFQGTPNLSLSDVGHPIASFYGYKFEGLDNEGNPVYADISGPDGSPDGEISAEYDKMIIGNPYPDITYGFNVRMEYKGFDLTTFLNGVQGNDVVNASMGYGFPYSNRTTKVLYAWSNENPNSNVMRPSALDVVNNEFSDYYIEDGSYLRVRNITLGYNFSNALLKKFRLTQLRLYVSVNNFFTFTKYSGFDPEIGANNDPRDVGIDRGFYPQAKSVIGGIQLAF
ncbi:SusC/RagA family TonB-linked outer membrane protein [Xanthovirga aplysinae]|uniref:SusC/RagA family TonB-linked outer membrane protein n=1 Tax=Xanthovirga aplysinae TaxID=2529853 RepID=UPI001656F3FD|nr:SusC/RagA family TonB-linked outer membrane protein [Xanthovirga aplysinae]